MQAKREFRDRPESQVSVLDALVERTGEGMTVLELRAAVDEDIDTIERALSELKTENLIEIDTDSERTRIRPADRVVPDPEEVPEEEMGVFEALRDRFGF
jgi:predicted transcriptional regulator